MKKKSKQVPGMMRQCICFWAAVCACVLLPTSAFAADVLTDLTSPDGIITYSSSHKDYPGTFAFDNVVDSNGKGRWLPNYATAEPYNWVTYQFTEPTYVNVYRITALTSYSVEDRSPLSMRLEGSQDHVNWELLDSQTDLPIWSAAEVREFRVANPGSYVYYRFTIIARYSGGSDNYTGVSEIEYCCDSSIIMDAPVWSENAYTVSASIDESVAATGAQVYYGLTDGGEDTAAWTASVAASYDETTGLWSATIPDEGLTGDATYYVTVAATDAEGAVTWALTPQTFVTGVPALEALADADETTLSSGSFRVTRPAGSSEDSPLKVFLSVSGTAVAGTDYVLLPESVTIPAGTNAVDVAVTPLFNAAVTEDTTVVIALAAGAYRADASVSAAVTIKEAQIDPDSNAWIGSGNASDASNWSYGRVPTSEDAILLSQFSTGDMIWDAGVNGLPDTVASWTQTAEYTGTVTFQTVYPEVGTFNQFTVTGNASVEGGTWTQAANTTATATYCLKVASGGTFTLGEAAAISVRGKGFPATRQYPGTGGGSYACGVTNFAQAYGNVLEPVHLGNGPSWGSNAGGGAFHLVSAGAVILNGTVSADTQLARGTEHNVYGAAGSIFVRGSSIDGTGTISANGGSGYNSEAGSGGRIALVATEATSIGIPEANITALGGWGFNGDRAHMGRGPGTIYLKHAGQEYGTLLLKDSTYTRQYGVQPPDLFTLTPVVPGETWTFDEIKLGGNAILVIPENAKLSVPNGLSSITALDSNYRCGIILYGGTFDVPSSEGTDTWVFDQRWIYQPLSPTTIRGNVIVKNGGVIGACPFIVKDFGDPNGCHLTVTGDVTVEAGGRISAARAGLDRPVDTYQKHGFYGGQSSTLTGDYTYGSILNPDMPAMFQQPGDYGNIIAGGGVIDLTVGGTLTVNGTITTWGENNGGNSASHGVGGSINVRAGYLAGTGTINSNGGQGAVAWSRSGGGGRIAVRLTKPDATFDAFGLSKITAYGYAISGTDSNWQYSSSCGTVYLQDGSQAEGFGTVWFRDPAKSVGETRPTTYFPSTARGGESDDLQRVTLAIDAVSAVSLTRNVFVQGIDLASADVRLDLNGRTLTTNIGSYNGERLLAGTYAAGDLEALTDSTGGGALVVTGGGTIMLVQ